MANACRCDGSFMLLRWPSQYRQIKISPTLPPYDKGIHQCKADFNITTEKGAG